MLIGVLAAGEQTRGGVAKRGAEVGGGGVEHCCHSGRRQSGDEASVVLEHLLEVRDTPVLGRRVPEEPTFDVVVRRTAGHALQRVYGHLAQLFVAAQLCLLEQQQDGLGLRKFRRHTKAAELRVVRAANRLEDGIDQGGVELTRATRGYRAGPLAALEDLGRDLGAVGPVVGGHPPECAGHLLRRQIGGAGEDVTGRGEKGGGRPASHVVALVDVRPYVIVDTDR